MTCSYVFRHKLTDHDVGAGSHDSACHQEVYHSRSCPEWGMSYLHRCLHEAATQDYTHAAGTAH